MLLITGPGGNVGRELVEVLNNQYRAPWRVASRNPQAVLDELADCRAEAARLDFFDRSTWASALVGVCRLDRPALSVGNGHNRRIGGASSNEQRNGLTRGESDGELSAGIRVDLRS